MSNTLTLRLDESLAKELAEVAKQTNRSKSFHAKRALSYYLEDQADLEIALERLKDSSDEVVSLETMRDLVS